MFRSHSCLAACILALGLAACSGGPPKGVLEPVAVTAPGVSLVQIHVATTRARTPETLVGMFTGERAKGVNHARLTVSVPPTHTVGELEWPRTAVGDPRVNFVTAARAYVANDEFVEGVRRAVAQRPASERTVLVFVHGYNTRFEEAVYRLAQIVHDSGFKGVPVLFTWPSRGELLQYPYDRESAIYSRDDLEATLRDIARRSGASKFDVLAHSMGNMLAMETLRQATIRGDGRFGGKLGEVMLAAPDIDIDVFRRQIATIGPLKLPITIFISSDDRALSFSRVVWGGQARAGAYTVSDPATIAALKEQNITVYDLSSLRSGDALNHGKFATSPQVVQVIGRRLASDNGIATRGPGLGEGLVALGSAVGAGVGTAASVAVAVPEAVIGGAANAAAGAAEAAVGAASAAGTVAPSAAR